MQDKKTVVIDARFCGPPNSGNGGYVCGIVADFIEGPAEIMLRQPPPLDKPLEVKVEEGIVALYDGEDLIATGASKLLEIEQPTPPTEVQAIMGTEMYYGFHDHPFDSCFVCGPARRQDDGLRIFAGPYDSAGNVAAPWTPTADLFDAEGKLLPRYIWAALDCPGYAAIAGEDFPTMMLGKLNLEIINEVYSSEKLFVKGWKIGQERRKYYAGTALFNSLGEIKAIGKAIWIKLEK